MSEFQDKDPWLFCDGDPASAEELAKLEHVALFLVEQRPPTITRGYAYQSGDKYLVFQLEHDTDPNDEEEASSLILTDDERETDLLIFKFDKKNNLMHLGIEPEDDLSELSRALQAFIDEDLVDEEERAIVEHVCFILSLLQSKSADEIEAAAKQPISLERQHISDIIRSKVMERTTAAVHTREFGIILSGFTLHILKQDLIEDDVDAYREEGEVTDFEDFTPLQVLLTDEVNSREYVYDKTVSGHTRLRALSPFELYKEDTEGMTPEDEEVDALKLELGFDAPTQSDVALMTEKLTDAAVDDTLAPIQN